MRVLLIIVGIVVIALGIGAMMGKFTYQKKDQVAAIAGVSLTATHDQAIPQWAGILAIVVGSALVLGGTLKNK